MLNQHGPAEGALPHISGVDLAKRIPIAELAQAFQQPALRDLDAPLRLISGDATSELLVMPATSATYAGVKVLTIVPSNAQAGDDVIKGLYLLFCRQTGRPLATFDAEVLTLHRTAAVSAVATARLAKPDASTLLMMGSGRLVPYLAEGHTAVRPIRRILVWARDTAKAAMTARRIRERCDVERVCVVTDAESAVRQADIVSTATRATQPIVHGDWLMDGAHLDLVGGYRPDMREADDRALARARLFVDTLAGALNEAGDVITPLQHGIFDERHILGDFDKICQGYVRQALGEITAFKTVGNAVFDLRAAAYVWERY